jgi:ABC-type antimicrobial peptide transport system permease subunit
LGLLLGSVALGVVVLRNVLERRSELALLRAVGFTRRKVGLLILFEHWVLLAAGLLCGSVAGFVAVIPSLRSAGGAVPGLSLLLTLAALAFGGILWIYLATASALRGPMLSALRGE